MKYLLFKFSCLKIMLTCFLFALFALSAQAQYYKKKVITLKAQNESIVSVLNGITQKEKIKFFYSNQQVDVERKITIKEQKIDLENALQKIFKDANVEFIFQDNEMVLIKKKNQNRKKIICKGKILDEENNPIIGATVSCGDTGNGTITNIDGDFSLSAEVGDKLRATFIGYKQAERIITDKTSSYTIYLKEDVIALDNVVVTGYQTISRERATGSFSILSKDKLDKRIQMDVVSKLEGMVPGLTSYNGKIEIRGQSTLRGNAAPLYVVDGFPYEGSLSNISPNEIENITVLKDASAASIYGARSANGVIVITTKMGSEKKTDVEYNGSFTLGFLKDQRDYLNLMNSSELVDFQTEMFNVHHTPANQLNDKRRYGDVETLLYKHEAGLLNEQQLQEGLDVYRNRDNRNEFEKLDFMKRSSLNQLHNLSIRGGDGKYKYSINTYYKTNSPNDKDVIDTRFGYDAKGSYNFFKWLKVDLNVLGSYSNYENSGKGFSPTFLYTGSSGIPSYQTIWDEQGNMLRWDYSKSDIEINRLKSIGLYDEYQYPLKERDCYGNYAKSNYSKVNLGVNFKILQGLSFDVKFQTEIGNNHSSDITLKDARFIRQMINDSSIYNESTKELTQNIPSGGIIKETRGIQESYTLRAQFNYNKIFKEKHSLSAIFGAERRSVSGNSTYSERYGYDPVSLSYKAIDETLLNSTIRGTEAMSGTFVLWPAGAPRSFYESLNRYVSFYGNAGYTFDSKYDLSASIRIDQSNLFGTDPKLQYRPLWSFGMGWHIEKEKFMKNANWVNQLTLRFTKGINGNIPKEGGPYMIAKYGGLNSWTGEYSSYISSPPNSGLRWERTDQTNIGLNYSIFKNRISGSIEYYNKSTSDLLGDRNFDSTTGWDNLTINYANMYNKGVEIALKTSNIQGENWNWNSVFNFSYNKNKITNLENSGNSVNSYINDTNVRVGLPIGTLYSVRWAGLDENGKPQAYKKDGTKVGSIADLSVEDLVESGTTIPPYAMSLSNDLSYKGLSLWVMLMMYTGNKMRDAIQPMITAPESLVSTANKNKDIRNYWKPGMDNHDESLIPGVYRNASENITNIWAAADKHILNAGYISLKEIIIAYALPKKMLHPLRIENLSLKCQIQNLATWGFNGKGLNPQSWKGVSLYPSMGYDTLPVYSFGVSVKF